MSINQETPTDAWDEWDAEPDEDCEESWENEIPITQDNLQAKFEEVRDLLSRQISEEDQERALVSSKVFYRVYDLMLAQIVLLKIEEAVEALLKGQTDEENIEDIRLRIGRRLDRIRATMGPDTVSE